jgi:hypothetical protein
MGAIFNVFPLILIPVLIFNIWAFGSTAAGTDPADVRMHLQNPMICVPMASQEPGAINVCEQSRDAAANAVVTQAPNATAAAAPMGTVHWVVSFGDLLILLSLILLFVELLKSTSTGTAAIFNHALSMLVFIICLVEFLLHHHRGAPRCGIRGAINQSVAATKRLPVTFTGTTFPARARW